MGQVSANTDRTREKLTEGEPRTDGQREGMKNDRLTDLVRLWKVTYSTHI